MWSAEGTTPSHSDWPLADSRPWRISPSAASSARRGSMSAQLAARSPRSPGPRERAGSRPGWRATATPPAFWTSRCSGRTAQPERLATLASSAHHCAYCIRVFRIVSPRTRARLLIVKEHATTTRNCDQPPQDSPVWLRGRRVAACALLLIAATVGCGGREERSADVSRAAATVAVDSKSEATTPPLGEAPEGMIWIPGGTFWMGGDDGSMADAGPVHEVSVDGFWMDRTEVTNRQFAAFVRATGYV